MLHSSWFLVGFGGLLASVVTLYLYYFMTGRQVLLDLRDRIRLQSRSLAAWDAFCAQNPHCSDLVICLTTTPSRLMRLEGVLKSLLYQTHRPQTIRLHLPEFSQREERPYVIPDYLWRLQSVVIVRCVDYGPATKLIPALEAYEPDQKLLIVDDDRLYPPDLVADFIRAATALPAAALAMSGWRVPADLTDRAVTLWDKLKQRPPAPIKSTRVKRATAIDVLMGYAAYLVKPAFFTLAAVKDYQAAPAAAFYVDDVWLSAHCQAPKYVFPARRHCFIPRKDWFFYDKTALYRINDGGGDPEKRNNTLVIRYFKTRWLGAA